MKRIRIIPTLLIQGEGLVKTIGFSKPTYIGDPINAVKIFNDKEVDELVVLDITASRENRPPNIKKIMEIAGEAFMPMGYGGGVRSVEDIKNVLFAGFEKVILNSAAHFNKEIIAKGAALCGSQSIVVSIDYKRNIFGKSKVYARGGKDSTGKTPLEFAREMADLGAGELILHSINREGSYLGYDLETIQNVAEAVKIPVIACGGARSIDDFVTAVKAGASAVAAGSFFVYRGTSRGILINYPSPAVLRDEFYQKI